MIAEVKRFENMKLKNFSSGMYLKLGLLDGDSDRSGHPLSRRGPLGGGRVLPEEVRPEDRR